MFNQYLQIRGTPWRITCKCHEFQSWTENFFKRSQLRLKKSVSKFFLLLIVGVLAINFSSRGYGLVLLLSFSDIIISSLAFSSMVISL